MQKRTHQENLAHAVERQRRRVCHAGEPEQPAAAREAKQHGLGLIVERVRGEDMGKAGARGDLGEQLIARVTRRLLQAGSRLLGRASAACGARTPSRRASSFTMAASRAASGRKP